MPELTRRYIVMPMATDGPFDLQDADAAFVLKPWKDPAARRALETYRDHCYPELAQELVVWLKAIAKGPVVLGGVGARNEMYMASRAQAEGKVTRKQVEVKKKAVRSKPPKKKGKRRS